MLKEKVGYPWTTLPDNLFAFGAGGFGGHGTLCGALGGSGCIINLITYEPGKAKSPLCHTSVSSWTLAAGAEVTSQEKIERCSKVCGEVVYTVVLALNEYFAGRWTAAGRDFGPTKRV